MNTTARHCIHRHPEAPGIELRISTGTTDCYRLHTHEQYSVGIIDEGEAVFIHPDGPDRVSAGSVVLIGPGVPHACNPWHQQRWSYRMLFIDTDRLQPVMAGHGSMGSSDGRPALRARTLRRHDAPVLNRTCDELCHPLHLAHGEWLLQMLAPQLAPWFSTPAEVPPRHDALTPALALIHAHADTGPELQIRQLAHACGMSASLFVRRFKAAFGWTPGQYLQNARINRARRLLAQGMPLAEVAQTAGFADQPHFQRQFKSRHAMTPGNYAATAELAPGDRSATATGGPPAHCHNRYAQKLSSP